MANDVIAYLLARLISRQEQCSVEDVLQEARAFCKVGAKSVSEESSVDKDEVESIYQMYPNKCPFRGASTGKGSKTRVQIEAWIKKIGYEQLKYRIQQYLNDCLTNSIYIKTFSALLNNLPEYDEPKKEVKNTIDTWQS